MKLYEIQHINQKHNPNKVMGEELRFVSEVSKISEKFYPAEKQPKDWDNVRRISHMLFLAWNDDNPYEGSVYLGEFHTPEESEGEKFYKFFEQFNKFPINHKQQRMYSMIKNGGHVDGGRRAGATVLLLTIAAYEAVINGKYVVYFGHNQDTVKLYEREFRNKWFNVPFLYTHPSNIVFKTFNSDMNVLFCGRSNVTTIFDNFWMFGKMNPERFDEQWDKYTYIANPIPNFKEYSINTF
jgi:hypothetical protein